MGNEALPAVGEVLSNAQIREHFGGQNEGGIRGSNTKNTVVVIHDPRTKTRGSIYLDNWDDAGILHYRGQGQNGDQQLARLNLRLSQSSERGYDVHLLEALGGGRYEYRGQVELADEVYTVQEADSSGQLRSVLIFPLRPKVLGSASVAPTRGPATITVPEDDDATDVPAEEAGTHAAVQKMLVEMGASMGLTVWVARNDRHRVVDGVPLGDMVGVRSTIPSQFEPATQRTIEHIDVLWFRGNSIEAAFEIEHTTAIYSGLLRMADLISMQPNLDIRLFIVAPEEKRQRVLTEIARPTFSALHPPLRKRARYISYQALNDLRERFAAHMGHVQPSIIETIAEAAATPED